MIFIRLISDMITPPMIKNTQKYIGCRIYLYAPVLISFALLLISGLTLKFPILLKKSVYKPNIKPIEEIIREI